ncbi:3-hydroxyacyl-CoA dehydrogenase family protein [Achromobacter aegrifaciens]
MSFEFIDLGESRAIPECDPLRACSRSGSDVVLVIGGDAADIARRLAQLSVRSKRAVVVELGPECLGFHTGEEPPDGKTNVLGFSRFRLGETPASQLVEIVRQPSTSEDALVAATAVFRAAGLEVSICSDVPGRIVDNLLRPYLNSALRSIDEGVASPTNLDQALRMGLGYPLGPIELLEGSGIEAHYQVSNALYEALGAPEFFPARRARIAAMRNEAHLGQEAAS